MSFPHLPGIRADHAEDALAFGIEAVGVVLEEDARIAVNGAATARGGRGRPST